MISHSSHIRHKAQGPGVCLCMCVCVAVLQVLLKVAYAYLRDSFKAPCVYLTLLSTVPIINSNYFLEFGLPTLMDSKQNNTTVLHKHPQMNADLKKKKRCITHYLKMQDLLGSQILGVQFSFCFCFPVNLSVSKNCFKSLASK